MKWKRFFANQLLVLTLLVATTAAADDDQQVIQRLSEDCFQEWSSRDWRLGEDATLVANIPRYVAAIKRICHASAELFIEGYPVSPFIHQSQRVILPFIFSGEDADVRQWLIDSTAPQD